MTPPRLFGVVCFEAYSRNKRRRSSHMGQLGPCYQAYPPDLGALSLDSSILARWMNALPNVQ